MKLRLRLISLLAALIVAALSPATGSAAESVFPNGYNGYHTYQEMVEVLDAVAADHPGIARKVALPPGGARSAQGRVIWALKISDNVEADEDEPEVLFQSLAHAREILSLEQNLRVIELLTENYRANPGAGDTQLERRVTDLVNGLEIWIVPMVNPDGAEYDISRPDDGFTGWRKNRQPVDSAVGIDLNRNYGYKWGCCRGSSGKPSSIYYRGARPWQSPEIAAVRDFVLSRIVGGRQQLRAAIDWHAFNEEIMWPFGYTTADRPRSMTSDDWAAFRAVGRGMAERNGYTAKQLSDLYVMDGNSSDWLYGDQRMFAFTIEVYPLDDSHVGGFHPPDNIIARETTRNDQPVLYFLEQAACPYSAAGLETHCGPLDDDFETGRGWQVNPDGSDNAPSGAWQRAAAARNATSAGVWQPAYGFSAQYALVTGAARGSSANANDLDGLTSVRSQQFSLGSPGSGGWTLEFRYNFAHGGNASAADYLRLTVGGDELWRDGGAATKQTAAWKLVELDLDAYAGQTIRLRFEACDCAADSLVEAAIDDVRVYRAQ